MTGAGNISCHEELTWLEAHTTGKIVTRYIFSDCFYIRCLILHDMKRKFVTIIFIIQLRLE